MRHLILCREYPPAPGGGIGAYVDVISRLLACAGETVHIIAQAWEGAGPGVEQDLAGRLVVHRLPFEDWKAFLPPKPHPRLQKGVGLALFRSGFHPQSFSWQAGLLAEKLVQEEGIDLIEAQEYEAPLYYFLLRRAHSLGPARRPPCLIHLHSPTEFIARFNEWDLASLWVGTASRLEDFCIAAADALLCPSQTFARQASIKYGRPLDEIEVIPLPMGDSRYLERAAAVWERGTICYMGRLERRKGVLEWLQAAVRVARLLPHIEFEFLGSNILAGNRISSQVMLNELVPNDLRGRFHFRGEQPRAVLGRYLSRARLAVVPSRWENFPYACIEAMASGLPVLATRQGGMVEMIADGRTGWLADAPSVDGLADALWRALAVPPHELAEMGRQASVAIHDLCANDQISARHREFRGRVALRPATRSLLFPANLLSSQYPGLPDMLAGAPRAAVNRRLRNGEPASSGLPSAHFKPGLLLRHPVLTARAVLTVIAQVIKRSVRLAN